MKLISIDKGFSWTAVVIEKNNVVYYVEVSGYIGQDNQAFEMYRERKIRKDSKLHDALCTFAESQLATA
jgi:hypothetical protein